MSVARAPSRRAIDDFLDSLPQLAIIVGKGGVGKTTCAVGVASHFASRGETTLLLSTDPANSLGPSLGVSLRGGEALPIEAGLSAMQLDAAAARQAFLSRWRDVLVTIMDRGTYLDAEDIGGLVDAAFPGADEIFGLLTLAELLAPSQRSAAEVWRRIVIDTAPTGHTLRLLELPETFDALIALLEAMQAKHRFMVGALTHRYRRDAADEFLDAMRLALGGLRSSLGDASRARAVLVTRAEGVVVRETERYVVALSKLRITVAAVVVEALSSPMNRAGEVAVGDLQAIAPAGRLFGVPVIEPPPRGLAEAVAALDRMTVVGERVHRGARKGLHEKRGGRVSLTPGGPPSPDKGDRSLAPLGELIRALTIVGGKGGVGKTTVSCALALHAVLDGDVAGDLLLVSTDPAPSIGDAFGISTPRWAHTTPETLEAIPRLHVWQMDANAAFQELRDRYRDRIDAVFDSLMGRSLDMAHDRAILRDLLSLAPPGIDELYALASLGEALEEQRYACIIVDPAPTGHLLRLLQLPTLAVEWSHLLMRLILKYREIAGLGEAAQDLLNFTRRTRALEKMLHDASRSGVVVVSLEDAVVRAETERLTQILRSSGIAIIAEVRNRAAMDATDGTPPILAPSAREPLIGVAAIREWSRHWRRSPEP